MNIENPRALHFIMQEDVFFLKEDKERYTAIATPVSPKQLISEEVPVQQPAKADFAFTGKINGVLILVHYSDQEFIHETHLSALENILKRRNLAVADVAILNLANNANADFESLLEHFSPEKILVLGRRSIPAGAPQLILNQPAKTGDKEILFSFSFDEMMDNPENKKAFWEQMKNF